MNHAEKSRDPIEIVARALGCPSATITADSAMKRTHKWDSLGHVSVVTALEEAYGVSISNEEMLSLTTMKAILKFHERQVGMGGNEE